MSRGTKNGGENFTAVEEGYNTDRHGPGENEEEGRQCDPDTAVRANILVYVVTIRRDDVLYCIRVNNQQNENGY